MIFRRLLKIAVTVALLAGVEYLLLNYVDRYVARIANLCCFSVMLAVSLNIINGYAGQFSLGHAGFYAVGAYSGGALTQYAGPSLLHVFGMGATPLGNAALLLAAACVGAVCAAAAGLIVGIPALRLKGDYLAIATLGFNEMIRVLILNVPALGGATGFLLSTRASIDFFSLGLFTVAIVWLSRNLLNSRQGRALQALRDDETAASVLGINVTQTKVMAFVLSSAMAGCAGALYSQYDGFLQPDSFNFIRSIELIIMVVVGGLGSTTGAVIAAIVLTVLPETLRGLADYRMVIYSTLLILTVLVRPQGLLGTSEFSWSGLRLRRKEAEGGLS
ncbi:MAG: branched-chain amino acid ABC transporter permease [Armatimonadetes bacterium]|nr:branched-chain amino acid ABC transporter permease [Armatimonadota bacterium]